MLDLWLIYLKRFISPKHRNPEPVQEGQHPALLRYKPVKRDKPADCIMHWDGSLFIPECLQDPAPVSQEAPAVGLILGRPDIVDEELFEWIDLIESVFEARVRGRTFTFVELGSGYGRWSVRAWNAAIRNGLDASSLTIVTVEAESYHSDWLEKNFALNGIPSEQHHHFRAAVSNRSGEGEFYVMQAGKTNRQQQARQWYGQALVSKENYWRGASTETVRVLRLEQILQCLPPDSIIDLVDMDLQGEDSLVLADSISILSRVRKLHIGTDSAQEDAAIFELLSGLGWRLVRRYYPGSKVKTAWGPIRFLDGVMTWTNPRLESK